MLYTLATPSNIDNYPWMKYAYQEMNGGVSLKFQLRVKPV